MTEDALLELPGGWVWTTLGDIISVHSGKGLTTHQMDQSGIFPVYGGNGITGYHNKFMFEESKLIIGRVGAKCGAVHKTSPKCWITDNALIVGSWLIDTNFLFHVLRNLNLNRFSVSTAQPVISSRKIYPISFGMPPPPEQRAIVAKIELLFSDLDNGIANLKKAQEQLKIYRQAVLKKAFEGELTRKWRAEQTDLPSAEELLLQIKEEREKQYQKQLDEWKKAVKEWVYNGKEGKKPSRPKKLKELPPLSEGELKELPELPESWEWVKLISAFTVSGGLTKNSKRAKLATQMPYLRVANVYANRLDLSEVKQIGVTVEEFSRYILKTGDLLVVEGNGSPDQIGRVAVWNGEITRCLHQNHLIKVRPDILSLSAFALYWLLSTNGRQLIQQVASSTSGLYTLNISKVENFTLPLCTIEEQHQIVKEIETRLSVCDKMEATLSESLQKSEALRQSILKKAFEGKLLNEKELEEARNAPDWEPADKLLERINAEKEKTGNKK